MKGRRKGRQGQAVRNLDEMVVAGWCLCKQEWYFLPQHITNVSLY
jgi:hypothetical protein